MINNSLNIPFENVSSWIDNVMNSIQIEKYQNFTNFLNASIYLTEKATNFPMPFSASFWFIASFHRCQLSTNMNRLKDLTVPSTLYDVCLWRERAFNCDKKMWNCFVIDSKWIVIDQKSSINQYHDQQQTENSQKKLIIIKTLCFVSVFWAFFTFLLSI